jgi:hypothetical protein
MNVAPADPSAGLRHSWWGIASLVLGVFNVLGAALSVALFVVIVGIFLYILVILSSLLGITLGVIGLSWRRHLHRRGPAIAGLVLNLLALLPFALIRLYD